MLSLLDEPVRKPSEAPTSDGWRPGIAYRSPHSRLDVLPRPGESFDAVAAAAVCAAATSELLGPLAEAVELLPRDLAERLRALVTYTRTLFDFAAQPRLEGERLAQINRLEFSLESALDGAPIGQPAFLRLAEEERRRPIPRDALDRLADLARRRVASGEQNEEELAAAFTRAWLGDAMPEIAEWATRQLRLGAAVDGRVRLQLAKEIGAQRPSIEAWPADLRRAARYATDAAALLAHRPGDRARPFSWWQQRRLAWRASRR